MPRRKYDSDEMEGTQIHLVAKDYSKHFGHRNLSQRNARDQIYGSQHEFQDKIDKKERAAYRVLKNKYGTGYSNLHDKASRKDK